MRYFPRNLFLFILTLALFPLARGEQPAPAREESIDWVAEMFKGGFTAVLLMVLAFGGLVIFIERLISVRSKHFLPAELERNIRKLVRTSDFPGIRATCAKESSALAQVATYIASHTHIAFEILSFGVMDMIGRTVSRQHQRTYPLAVVATLSPLLGLLGTMIGMIESFQKVALMGDTGDASILADSIGKALITTAIGLSVAIPSLAAYHYFKTRINHFGIRLEESVDNLMSPWLHPEVAAGGEEADPVSDPAPAHAS